MILATRLTHLVRHLLETHDGLLDQIGYSQLAVPAGNKDRRVVEHDLNTHFEHPSWESPKRSDPSLHKLSAAPGKHTRTDKKLQRVL